MNALQISTPRWVLHQQPTISQHHTVPLLVVGGGAAGLAAALRAAEHTEVLLVVRGELPASNSSWAQGGIAAALDAGDSPAAHVADTLIAGAGLSDLAAVELLAAAAPDLMRELAVLGVPLERAESGFELGLEGGHSHRRIVHAGDATGWALTSTLAEHAKRHPQITIMEGFQVVDLLTNDSQVVGVVGRAASGAWQTIHAHATILATGGAGALFGLTSNHPAALGEGIALAYRAGAEVADMEFVQFHPTVMRTRAGYGFLISEAVRGEGAILRSPDGDRFMPAYDPRAELAPRDVVARGIFAAMTKHQRDHVMLDLTHLSASYLERRFPTIYQRCREEGYDPATQLIPIAPAAHYLMGGIRTDLDGATSLPGLYAAGECACTGVHGANRLASNSLLECLVFGRRAADASLIWQESHPALPMPAIFAAEASAAPQQHQDSWRHELTEVLRQHVSLIRSRVGLEQASRLIAAMPLTAADQAEAITAANAALVAHLMITGALLRRESRGAHSRSDYPESDPAWQVHVVQQRLERAWTVPQIAVAADTPVVADRY